MLNKWRKKERYFYIFKMTDKTGSSNKSSSRAHSHSHRLIQPNKSEVSITVILARKTKFMTTPNHKKVSTNKCDIDGQPERVMRLSKPEVLISSTVWWQISLEFRRQTGGFRAGRARRKCQQVTVTSNDNRKYTVCGKTVSPKVVCHFLSNHLEFLCEILHVYYLFIHT